MFISQIAELTGLTPRAIRHYEDLGLVSLTRDALKDRWFDVTARKRLLFIAKLRRAGLSLADIRHVIDIGRCDPLAQRASVMTMLRLRENELAALRAFVEDTLSNIDELFDGHQGASARSHAPSPGLARPTKRRGSSTNACEGAQG